MLDVGREVFALCQTNLEISVEDSVGMEVFESDEDLREVELSFTLCELFVLQVEEELASAVEFQQEVQVALRLEARVKTCDEWRLCCVYENLSLSQELF